MSKDISCEAYLKDTGDAAVADGKNIYLRIISIKFGFKNLTASNPRVLQDTSADFNDQKAEVTYTGFEQPVITVSGIIDLDNSTGQLNGDTDKQIITVGRLFHLARMARTYRFWDSKIVKQIVEEPDTNAPTPYPETTVPVIIRNISFSAGASLNEVIYSLELMEDRE